MSKAIDFWEYQYIKDNPHQLLITWDDKTAYNRYQRTRWAYDKCYINSRYNKHKCYNLEKELPRKYPVMIKPNTNLTGLSRGAYKAYSKKDIRDRNGMIAQKFYEGTQYSTDVCIYKGEIVDYFTFIGHKDKNGSFICFESTTHIPKKVLKIAKDCGLKNAIINIECIDNNVIEMHLRPSLQFYDICGNMIKNYLEQLANDIPPAYYKKSKYEKTYSYVLRRSTDITPIFRSRIWKPIGVRSVQLCYEDGDKLSDIDQDEFSFRLACINGSDLDTILWYAKGLDIYLTNQQKCNIITKENIC